MNSICLSDFLKSSSHCSPALALLEVSVCRVGAVGFLIKVSSSQPWWLITIYQCAFEIWQSPSLSSTRLEVTNLSPVGILHCRSASSHLVLSPDWTAAAAAAAKSLQSCPTLCDPIDSSPPCSLVPGILQARTLEWVAIAFSNAWKWKVKVKSLSHVWLRDPMDCSLPSSPAHGIFQARVLEWVAIAFSKL